MAIAMAAPEFQAKKKPEITLGFLGNSPGTVLEAAATAAWALLALCFIDAKRAAFEINAVKRLNGCFITVFHFY